MRLAQALSRRLRLINLRGSKSYKFSSVSSMDKDLDDKYDEVATVKALTTKELKKLIKPKFEQNPDDFYPTTTLRDKLGFHRGQCEKCHKYFWNRDPQRKICGDSSCVGEYQFIGKGTGIGVGRETPLTIKDVWDTYAKSFGSEESPCTPIDRYPVVARWRNDVDFVLAGIFCFQPFCVTGELEAPANPLICPQFCVRFNDLDNIGLTGRHYSGFVMLGIQAFNKVDDMRLWKDQCVEYNFNWLTKHLKIDPSEITFMEDVWAGGGNLGPCIEYFIGGMEIGNMVFMQYKTFHDGSMEELPIKVIDVGIGLDRIPWLLNGSATSYSGTFPTAYNYFISKLGIEMNNEIWNKLGPLSCQLDIDECEDIDKTWADIATKLGEPLDVIKKAIEPMRDVFIILDHCRTLLMCITDGALPSNVGGGGNLRNILRRTFAIMKKNGWWDKMSFDEYLEIYEAHKKDLEGLYGPFKPYPSFNKIISIEYERWQNTESEQRQKLDKLLKKKKALDIDDWIVAMTSWGIPADAIAQISGCEIPKNLYYEIAQRQERVVKAAEQILYSTSHLPATKNLYYEDHHMYKFDAKVVEVFANLKQKNKRNIVILDQSAFYPTSGGQQHDSGLITILGKEYQIVDVEKVGKCVLHILDRELEASNDEVIGQEVICTLDETRRNQLRNHHTATHIVFAAARKVLGPHVWQQGAKKTPIQAHLDVTHFSAIDKSELLKIQDAANRIVMAGKTINKGMMEKSEAEKKYGFSLYQGGVVPGNELRIVNIDETDVEACCGTHCDNTSEVGWIKMITAKKIADGIVRLYFVAGERTISCLNEETTIISELTKMWSDISMDKLVPTAERIFKDYKKFKTEITDTTKSLINLQVRYACDVDKFKQIVVNSKEENPTVYFSYLEQHAPEIKKSGKALVYVGDTFIYGVCGEASMVDLEKLKAFLKEGGKNEKLNIASKKKIGVDGLQFNCMATIDKPALLAWFQENGYTQVEF